MNEDPRRQIPRTDVVLADPRLADAVNRLGAALVKDTVRRAQADARASVDPVEDLVPVVLELLPPEASSFRRVLNATGVVVHTNIGRAPLSAAAHSALAVAAGYVDVELDLASGRRSRRGSGVLDALRANVPRAEQALVVNNGAAALVLATTALAAGREVVISRGELVEIGDGFRLPELIASTGAALREVGTTNRTNVHDYAEALSERTGCILKVHPSNFAMTGFTSAATVAELAQLGVPVVADIGSGLLHPDPLLPAEPDATSVLSSGASIVTASGDKLLGGPQAGIILGRHDIVEQLRRHPLARALRVDKLTLAALEATLRGPESPVAEYLHLPAEELRVRSQKLAHLVDMPMVATVGRVGGGGGPGVELPGYAVSLPAWTAAALRTTSPAILGRVERGRCLLDLRCVPREDDSLLAETVRTLLQRGQTSE